MRPLPVPDQSHSLAFASEQSLEEMRDVQLFVSGYEGVREGRGLADVRADVPGLSLGRWDGAVPAQEIRLGWRCWGWPGVI